MTLTGAHTLVLAARATCDLGMSADLFCLNGAGPLSDTVKLTPNKTVYIMVSGGMGAEGPFTLHVDFK